MRLQLRKEGYILNASVVEIEVSISDSMLKLYTVGDLDLLNRSSIAVVGSRKASSDGIKSAEYFARDLVQEDFIIMSGLAFGIDSAAHRSAIRYGGRTIAVIGTPVDRAYPTENSKLQKEIYEKHLLISPFPIGMKIEPRHFPERNRVMARLANATVIIEAGNASGSLHQAAESIKINHPLFILESIINNKTIYWHKKFLNKPGVYVIKSSSDLMDILNKLRN